MSISHKELMALRRAQQQQVQARHEQEAQQQQQNSLPSFAEHHTNNNKNKQQAGAGGGGHSPHRPSGSPPKNLSSSSGSTPGLAEPKGHQVKSILSSLQQQQQKDSSSASGSANSSLSAGSSSQQQQQQNLGLSTYHAQRFFKSVSPASMEPKVFSAYNRVVGEIPREEALRRKRVQFDKFALDALLSERGIDYYRDGVTGIMDESQQQQQDNANNNNNNNNNNNTTSASGGGGGGGTSSSSSSSVGVAVRFPSYHRLLPLEAFDDYSYDDYSPQDWMEKGVDHDESGKQLGLPCLSVQVDMNARGKWVPGRVLEWDSNEHRLLIYFEESGEQCWKPRIDVFLFAEDPVKFADRVAAAHARRKEAESKLRFNLCVESMPVDESQVMSRDMIDRVRVLAVSSSELVRLEDRLDLPSALREINTDYGRAMNRQLFERSAHTDPVVSSMLAFVKQPKTGKLSNVAPAPEKGKIGVPGNDQSGTFAAILSSFNQTAYFNQQDEVVLALQRVRSENDSVLEGTELFAVSSSLDSVRPLSPRDFDDTQTVNMNNGMQHLRETWRNRLRGILSSTLAPATELDPVHLTHKRKNEYLGSKTEKFMKTVKLTMQDTLHYLLTSSLEGFVRFLEENLKSYTVEVHDLSTVKSQLRAKKDVVPERVYGNDLRAVSDYAPRPTPPPLFRVALVEKEGSSSSSSSSSGEVNATSAATAAAGGGGKKQQQQDSARISTSNSNGMITYDFDESEVLRVMQEIFLRVIQMGQEVPILEGSIFDFLLTSPPTTIAAIDAKHPIVRALMARVEAAVNAATAPMQEYCSLYDPFLDIVRLTVQDLEKNFTENPRRLNDMEFEMKKWQTRRDQVQQAIPQSVQLGGIRVECADLRKRLMDKCTSFVNCVKNLIATKGRKIAEDIEDKFSKIRSQLIKEIETPEECVEIQRCIDGIPEAVFDLNITINEMREVFDTLDKHCVILSEDDFLKKWKAVGWPARLEEDVARTKSRLEVRKNELISQLEGKQATLDHDITKLRRSVAGFTRYANKKKVADYAAEARNVLADIQRHKEDAAKFAQHEQLLQIPVDDRKDASSLVAGVNNDFKPYATLWLTCDDWNRWQNSWQSDNFESIDAEEMERNVIQAGKNIASVIRDPSFKNLLPILEVAEEYKNQIDEFKPLVPSVKFLRTAGMKARHWESLSQSLGFEVQPGTTLNLLSDVTSLDLPMHEDILRKVSEIAAREYGIETALEKMLKDWGVVPFNLKSYKKTGCHVMGKESMDKIQEILDDQMLTTQALTFSPFKKHFEREIEEWDETIKLIQHVIDGWKNTQKIWMYLEPIFQSDDIMRQLPAETKRFGGVYKNYKFLSNRANELGYCLAFCQQTEDVQKLFDTCNEDLEKVQKGLNQYLENKRSSFPRFYFNSDDELLTILSEAKDPRKIQPHFKKLFEAIHRIDMRDPDCEMFGMISALGERVAFKEPVIPRKNVENWLTDIEVMMKRSIRHEVEKGMQDREKQTKKEFVLKCCGQVGIAVNQIMWTANCENSLNKHGSLQPYVEEANAELMILVDTVRGDLTTLQQMNLGGMITIEVHARDIVESLAEQKVSEVTAFEWVSQLRFYFNHESRECEIAQIEARFVYGCEYLGNSTRLVVTPLTDRIYLTLTGAMHMYLGAAPAGPAGTGKTETTKDLAKALSKQCVVFNCQEGMTYQSMGKFFKGLANAGAWACFDEFNRINVEVLSVVAQQVGELQEANRTKQYRITFEGAEIVVDPTHAVFITMNPGYAGRTELPDNLKVLFRPVACMVPDYAMIAEIRLFSYGYKDARKLAQKMVATFRLSSEQLSSQSHYDFGMRAVNTVISAAGNMKRQYPDDDEDVLLLRALADSNKPKFLEEDLLLFSGIIADLFPKLQIPAADYGLFKEELHRQALAMHLEPTELFLQKCVQIYEMTVLRHGQMQVGPAMSGKSSAAKVLQKTMTELSSISEQEKDPRKIAAAKRFAEVKMYPLNPKSVTLDQLYGGFDEGTGEWRDGLIGELFRIAAGDPSSARQWILFDGPVDAIWIESMNTVLDENKKLCLVSGEIIQMSKEMNIWFEVEDLAVASPATVSRAGMIYLEPTSVIGVEGFVRCWVDFRLPKNLQDIKESLKRTLNSLLPPLLAFVDSGSCTEYQATVWPNLLQSMFNIFNGYLEPYTPTRTYDPPPEKIDFFKDAHMQLLIYSIVWSLGASCDNSSRKKFDRTLRDEIKRQGIAVQVPDVGLIHDYEYVLDEKRWVPWLDRASTSLSTKVDSQNFADIIVPTIDVIRYKSIFKHLITTGSHVLAVGPTGTGKSLIINDLLMKGLPSEYSPIFFTFSARTSANQTQDLIFSKFEARRRASPQIWGAPIGKKFVVLLDDMNMPLKEKYGAQPPVELMRQFADYKGWFNRKEREFFNIVDVLMVGAMGPPGGGRNKISNRFLRHFNFIAFPEIEEENMRKIFTSILDNFIVAHGFNESIAGKVQLVVDSSIEVYKTICSTLLPRPSKPHYLFNLRDLAKVISGLLSAEPKLVPSAEHFLRLWIHEQSRTFRDRLVDDADRSWFDETIRRQLQTRFKMRWADVVPGDTILFADFMHKGQDLRSYEEVTDPNHLCSVCYEYLADYNKASLSHKMNLVLFLDAVQHVMRITRVLAKPSGHALLLGVGGSGRQSAAKLASFIAQYDTRQVEVSRGYGVLQWREDVKNILRHAAFKSNQTTFIITDTQCVNEQMLEDINNMLNAGEVPNLFVEKELDELNLAMKPICVYENIPVDKVNLYARFVKGCKAHLHVVLAMSPIGEPFRNRLRMFPALIACTTIDWYQLWPEPALLTVGQDFLTKLETPIVEEHRVDDAVTMFVYMHSSVEKMSKTFLEETKRQAYVTPTSYLELLHTFENLIKKQTAELHSHRSRLVRGLDTLRDTEVQIAELRKQLEHDQPLLKQRKDEIAKMVEEISEETATAEITRTGAVEDERIASVKTDECQKIFDEADEMLKAAQPMLDAALESLKMLKPGDFVEVNSYKVYTPGVKMTLEGLMLMFGEQCKWVKENTGGIAAKKVADWVTPAKEYLGKAAQLMDKLINYDKEAMDAKLIKGIEHLVKSEDFTPEKIAGASKACAALCAWVHAMYKYYFVLLEVRPLRQKLAVAKAELQEVEAKRDAARAKVAAIEERLAYLNGNKEEAETEMQTLQATVEKTEIKLVRAGMLIDGLAGEKKNWNNTIAQLNDKEQYLFGDLLAAAGQIAYLGPYTSKYRQDLLEQWKYKLNELSILHSPMLSLYHTLQEAVETRQWNIAGLPADQLSVENGLMVKYSRRYPLMIDPQTQANKWIRKMYGEPLEIVRPTNKDMIKRIEHGIRNGRPVLLENVGPDVDPALDPLLQQQVFVTGGTEMIKIGDNPIPWNSNFRFFMTTKLPNPEYIPEVQVKVALLNFFITPKGLEDQLLGVIVNCERQELEMKKNQAVQQSASMRAEISNLQKKILKSLEEVGDNDILENEELIRFLDQSKVQTKEITEKVAESEATEREVDEIREKYRPVAKHGSLLYFCCADLSSVDPMYQYSLQWFIALFENSMKQAEEAEELSQRLENLENFFTYSFYSGISRSLFEKHKLMFSFVLAVRILRAHGEFNLKEWITLISGPIAASSKSGEELANPAPSWLTDASWRDILCLERDFPSAFKGFGRHFHENIDFYEQLFLSQDAHREPLAGDFANKLTSMQRMLFMRAIRPDKIIPAVQDFVKDHIGEKFIKAVPFDLSSSFKDASPIIPLVFILSPGADPKQEFNAFAESQRMNRRLAEISLGQGQGPKAERFIKEGMENGMWVLLMNAHLAASWMPTLDRLVEQLQHQAATVNPVFRLWITSMPNPDFPVTILQNGVKMTNEPPKGMPANVARSLNALPDGYLERCKKPREFKKLVFAYCFFHALIQERRKFGPLGWNIAYEYAPGDLKCCIDQLRMFLDKYDEVPFRVIRELSGNIHYGGRVTDDWDRRTLNTLLAPLLSPDTLQDGYAFSTSGVYNSIVPTDVQGYMGAVNEWPLNTKPEAFGLHDNADITCARAETYDTLSTIVKIETAGGVIGGGGGGSGGKGPDEQVTELAQQILSRVRQAFDLKAFHSKYPTKYEDSMNTVLVQEAGRFNNLITVVRSTLTNLMSAVKGLVVMSKDLEEVYSCLLINTVPGVWAEVAFPSMKPLGAWVSDLTQRLQMIETWYENGHPRAFWISGFFFPQAFLTGTLQNYARQKQISIDTISYSFEWTSQNPETLKAAPPQGCYIYGTYIEGARINPETMNLEESRPKVLFESAPMVWLNPTINRTKPAVGIYDCPLYKTVRRAGTLSTTGHSTNYVLTLEANTEQEQSHWIKRGVAMVCSLSY